MNLWSLVAATHEWTSTLVVEWEAIVSWITTVHIHRKTAIVILTLRDTLSNAVHDHGYYEHHEECACRHLEGFQVPFWMGAFA